MPTLRMPNINQVAVSGTLCQDPDFRFMDDGQARCRARVAVNRSWRDRNQAWQEETSYFDVVLRGRAAETLCEKLTKGTPVFITGRLQSLRFRDDHDQPPQRVHIQVRNLQILEEEEESTCQP